MKKRFHNPDGGKHGSLQSCIRTNDLNLVGDGSHLTYFEMLGNFSFGGDDYESSIDLWDSILRDLLIPVTEIHVHPTQSHHEEMWKHRGYEVVHDDSCQWSDGEIGGYCCEVFCNDLEVGNLVNPQGHSVDVGFGWERMHQIVEGKKYVHDTSLFNQQSHPIVRDHSRTLTIMKKNGIIPGGKGRGFVCRRLLRRMFPYLSGESFDFQDWIEEEKELQKRKLGLIRRVWRRHLDKSPDFWWNTYGVLPEDLDQFKGL